MIKKICFYSTDFAHNRFVRLRFYEKIFPKDVNIFFFTLSEKERWKLKRTNIYQFSGKYCNVPFSLRKFCKENKIDRIINLGNWGILPILFFATFLSKTDYVSNFLGANPNKAITRDYINEMMRRLIFKYISIILSKRLIVNDYIDYLFYKKIRYFILKRRSQIFYLPIIIDTGVFKKLDKKSLRKRLSFPIDKKILIYVGRVNSNKGSDVLEKIIKINKDKLFIIIGPFEENFNIKNLKNVLYFENIPHNELPNFYNCSDLGLFLLKVDGGGFGFSPAEALSCGIPILYANRKGIINSSSIINTNIEVNDVNNKIRSFFKLSPKEKKEMSVMAIKYIIDNYSEKSWKNEYIRAHLS